MRPVLALGVLAASAVAPVPASAQEVISAPFTTVPGVEVVAPPVSNGSVVGRDGDEVQTGVVAVLRLTGEPQQVAEAFAEQVCATEYAQGRTSCGAEREAVEGAELWTVVGDVGAGGPGVRVQVRRDAGADEGLVLLVHGGDSCGAC